MRIVAAFAVALALAGAAIAVAELHDEPTKPPIVFVVFDALPESMLMKPGGRIDAARFPGFAELAAQSTWYRNATTVHDRTIRSIPAMLDGRWPSNLREPILADHPVNLFTLLHRSYRIWADEEGTRLCPVAVCGRAPVRLGPLLHGRREQRFERAMAQIGARSTDKRPTLWFIHSLLPHEPLRFLPSGKVYERGVDPEPGLDGNESFDNEFLTHQAEQRHLLQLEYTDALVRKLLARLRASALYDKALIVVTADHGISFRVKSSPAEPYRLGQIGWRRDLTRHNGQDIAFVPLFVKKPGQHDAKIDDSWVRTVDILPMLLREAGAKQHPRALAGRALGDKRQAPRELQVVTNRAGVVALDRRALARKRELTIDRRARRFGTGANVNRLYTVGPHTELLGRPLASLTVTATRGRGRAGRGAAAIHARLWGPRRFLEVDPRGHTIPADVTGWLDGRKTADRDLALAVNGRIASVGRSFKPIGATGLEFSLMVPESAFRQGFNDIRIYELVAGSWLVELGRSPRS
jgi:sulfatase-like protein